MKFADHPAAPSVRRAVHDRDSPQGTVGWTGPAGGDHKDRGDVRAESVSPPATSSAPREAVDLAALLTGAAWAAPVVSKTFTAPAWAAGAAISPLPTGPSNTPTEVTIPANRQVSYTIVGGGGVSDNGGGGGGGTGSTIALGLTGTTGTASHADPRSPTTTGGLGTMPEHCGRGWYVTGNNNPGGNGGDGSVTMTLV